MKEFILGYIIVQLFSTAFGLAVIESVRPLVIQTLEREGYIKNKNSLYNFSYTLINILKGFIPFYYLLKSINLIATRGDIQDQVRDLIKNKAYVKEDEVISDDNDDIQVVDNVFKDEALLKSLEFEKPEKYTARRNDITLLDTYETPVEYITRESNKDDHLELTPFINKDEVVKEVVVKDDVTNKDIAKAICNLSIDELKSLKDKIETLELIKITKKELKLEKDNI